MKILKQQFIRKKSILTLTMLLLIIGSLSGCKAKMTDNAVNLENIKASEVNKIELSGSTGGENGEHSHTLSKSEKSDFVELLNQVELGDEVNKEQALSNGAVTYYKLYFQGQDPVTISSGHYFYVDGKYYEFVNFDELWDEFVSFNSL